MCLMLNPFPGLALLLLREGTGTLSEQELLPKLILAVGFPCPNVQLTVTESRSFGKSHFRTLDSAMASAWGGLLVTFLLSIELADPSPLWGWRRPCCLSVCRVGAFLLNCCAKCQFPWLGASGQCPCGLQTVISLLRAGRQLRETQEIVEQEGRRDVD